MTLTVSYNPPHQVAATGTFRIALFRQGQSYIVLQLSRHHALGW